MFIKTQIKIPASLHEVGEAIAKKEGITTKQLYGGIVGDALYNLIKETV